MKTIDGGQTWASISMAAHANLLIDNFFADDLHGWVVGGKGGKTYDELKPVVLFTADGGKTWENRLENSGIDFPRRMGLEDPVSHSPHRFRLVGERRRCGNPENQ